MGVRGKQIFTATEVAYKLASEATEDAISELRPAYPDIMVGLANIPLLDRTQIRTAFAKRKKQLEERSKTIKTTLDSQRPLPDFVEAIFSYSLSLLQAERKWLTKSSHLGNYE